MYFTMNQVFNQITHFNIIMLMKKIVEINSTNYASTGNIMINIAEEARKSGYDVHTFCKDSKESRKHLYNNNFFIGNRYERILSDSLAYITGLRDRFNIFGTYRLIKKIDEIKPDLIHLHTLHDNYINIKMLFNYLKKKDIPIVWTFHDSWALTGQCSCFSYINCNKWEKGCFSCPQKHVKPASFFLDTSKYTWKLKKNLFTSVKDLTITTPSIWLNNLVQKSYFSKYPIITINNGTDLSKFIPKESNFKLENNIENKYMVLGVANYWVNRKGLNAFIELSKNLPDNYKIVLVGTSSQVDKILPNNIFSIHRTYNQEELVKIYTAADVFVNPTLDDVFGLVNVEALACGTPVITYKTGGCTEIVNETCGSIIEKNNIEQLKNEIIRVCQEKPYKQKDCIKQSKKYDIEKVYKQYIDLYNAKTK